MDSFIAKSLHTLISSYVMTAESRAIDMKNAIMWDSTS